MAGRAIRELLRPGKSRRPRTGRGDPTAVALVAYRESMGVGMRRSSRGAAQQGSTAREAIRHATLLAPGKQPGLLTAAVEEAERGVSSHPAEPAADPPASEDAG